MNASFRIPDPTTALMLTHLEVDDFGHVRSRWVDLRRRQRRYQTHAKPRKLLA